MRSRLAALLWIFPALAAAQSAYELAQGLEREGLHATAAGYYMEVVSGGRAQPSYLKAVEGLVETQRRLDDSHLIPNFLAAQRDPSWQQLPPQVRWRIDYLLATVDQHDARPAAARELLRNIPPASPLYAKARYLLGVVEADPQLPGGPRQAEALAAFEDVLRHRSSPPQEDLEETRQLALLGIGRIHYGRGEYRQASQAYERVPRMSRYWDRALVENAFAHLRDEDFGGALGSLKALHAPQLEGTFHPESYLLEATVFHLLCLYEESQAALQTFERRYLPLAEKLKPLVERDAQVLDLGNEDLPEPVVRWVRTGGRLAGLLALLKKMDEEKAAIAARPAWRGGLAATLEGHLERSRHLVVQAASAQVKRRLTEAYRSLQKLRSDGDMVRLETTLAQMRQIEQDFDRDSLLKKQRLHRPGLPGDAWEYWQFQGEYWIDEVGYYQYTIKRGCPAPAVR